MIFIKTNELRTGMRLAKPIYNRNGILLYERGSKLTEQGILAVENFGLIGLYILEPGEALPPITPDDIEFERFQAVTVLSIKDEMDLIQKKEQIRQIDKIADIIIQKYGKLNKKINFVQNLRNKEDYIAKHSINVAILGAMMSGALHNSEEKKKTIVTAALLHDIGKLSMPKKLIGKEKEMTREESKQMSVYREKSVLLIGKLLPEDIEIKQIVSHMFIVLEEIRFQNKVVSQVLSEEAKVLMVAEMYDILTAMNDFGEPSSEVAALKYLLENKDLYGENIVEALIQSVHFLTEGYCIRLSNGEEGLVLARNNTDVLRPRVLSFKTNQIIELNAEDNTIEIIDAVKTLDNRYVIDRETWNAYMKQMKEHV